MRIYRSWLTSGGLLLIAITLAGATAVGGPVGAETWLIAGVSAAIFVGQLVVAFTTDHAPEPASDPSPDPLAHLEALARQDQLATLGLLAASVGHEIRNVISVVKMRLYLARQQIDGEVADELKSVSESITRLEDLAEQLSPYPDTEDRPREGFPLREAIDGALEVVEPKTDAELDLEVAIEANPDLPGESSTFTQVLVNLLLNACDAVQASDDPHIVIRVERDDDRAVVVVEDNGDGLPMQPRERLFEPFFSTKGENCEGGTGIGLWLCRKLVQQRDGTIRAENHEDGARFTIEVPIHNDDPSLERAPTDLREFPHQPGEGENLVSEVPVDEDPRRPSG